MQKFFIIDPHFHSYCIKKIVYFTFYHVIM